MTYELYVMPPRTSASATYIILKVPYHLTILKPCSTPNGSVSWWCWSASSQVHDNSNATAYHHADEPANAI